MFLFFVLASDRLIDRRNATLWEEMGYPPLHPVINFRQTIVRGLPTCAQGLSHQRKVSISS
jgi:hypothetical protein